MQLSHLYVVVFRAGLTIHPQPTCLPFLLQRVRRKWLARWAVNLLTGVGTAVVATVIEVCIEYSAEYKFWALKRCILFMHFAL